MKTDAVGGTKTSIETQNKIGAAEPLRINSSHVSSGVAKAAPEEISDSTFKRNSVFRTASRKLSRLKIDTNVQQKMKNRPLPKTPPILHRELSEISLISPYESPEDGRFLFEHHYENAGILNDEDMNGPDDLYQTTIPQDEQHIYSKLDHSLDVINPQAVEGNTPLSSDDIEKGYVELTKPNKEAD